MQTIAVFGGSAAEPGQPAYEESMILGRLLAESGMTILNGGYGGVMEAVSKGAAEAGGTVVGVTSPSLFPGRSGGNRWLTTERPQATLTERIHDLISLSDASISMPGSLGTLTELTVAWNDAYIAGLRNSSPKPVIAVGEPWRTIIPQLTTGLETKGDFVTLVDTVAQAHSALLAALPSAS